MTVTFSLLNNSAISQELGSRIRDYRLRSNLTQVVFAQRAGVSLSTLKALEKGVPGTSMDALFNVLRALSALDRLNALLPSLGISPMEMLKIRKNKRLRASKKKTKVEVSKSLIE